MSEAVHITILVENSVHRRDLRAEHGLAYHISIGGTQVLFDTGQTDLLLANAHQLGIDLSQVETIVLSHGHYDHTGGLTALRSLVPEARIVMHPEATQPKFVANPDGSCRTVGMSEATLNALATAGIETCGEQPIEVADGLFVTGEIPRLNAWEDVGGKFSLDPDGRRPDSLVDDQALFFESTEGTVVLLGCAHAGVINTLHHIEKFVGATGRLSVLGGMHLLNASEERLEFTVQELRQRDVQSLVPLHCTGWDASIRLWNAFPGLCVQGGVGRTFDFRRR